MNIIIAENNKELDQAYTIRMKVFVDEQNVPPEVELDEHDRTAIHFIGYQEAEAIAASRLRFTEDYGKLERICVLKSFRGKSYGKQLIQAMEETIKKHHYQKAKLNAQTHAVTFYESLGYRAVSDEFMDAGIPHVTMVKQL
jgi:predicted GNAT family N-acyltransferase